MKIDCDAAHKESSDSEWPNCKMVQASAIEISHQWLVVSFLRNKDT